MNLNLTQKKLGDLLNVHRKTISRWEKEESPPARQNYKNIRHLLDDSSHFYEIYKNIF